MKVELELPDQAYERLAEIAKGDATTVEQVILELLVCDCCGLIRNWCACDNDE